MIRRLSHLSKRDADAIDRGLAGLLFAVVAANLVLGPRRGPLALNLLVVAFMTASLLWRRRRPLVTAGVIAAGGGVLVAALTAPSTASSLVAVIVVAAYSNGAHLDLRRSLVGCLLLAGVVFAVCVVKTPADIFFPVVFFALVPWSLGRVIRNQTALARELTERADQEQAAREQEEALAMAAERARVARELHDVLAHNLSVMVIQAAAARRVVEHDPGAAVEAAELISRTGREALGELRHVFGPVRREDGEELGAAPGLAHLDQLASRAHRSGLPVEVRVEGEPFELSPGADLAVYRLVQEALTNTLKHGQATRASVTVCYRPSEVVVEVLDNGVERTGRDGAAGPPVNGGGHGLVGMRERVALYGGRLEAGRRSAGGFGVRAELPVGGRSR